MSITVYLDKHNARKERKSFQSFLRREKLVVQQTDYVFVSRREFLKRAFVGSLIVTDAFVSNQLVYLQKKRWIKLIVSIAKKN